ncbi:hypothetical protein GYMLUDRAFT_39839 [Collybiopsis luxurians FD-317 M1]|nr:hypothetical protein GYMLUDRAFT_39839 [Collybiopsis luxurians FD-317 M1]
MAFIRPPLNLGYLPDDARGANGLPELIEFNARHNPDHFFCLQSRAGEESFPYSITFAQLRLAYGEAYPNPVGVLLGSDITTFIYLAALLRIGTPVLCLSARLTPKAIGHLLQATCANTIIQDQHVARASKEVGQQSVHVRLVDALNYENFLNLSHSGHCGLLVPPSYTHRVRHEPGAINIHSSGTTGVLKPIYHPLPIYSCMLLVTGFGLLAPSLALSIGLPCILPSASIIPTARCALAALKSMNIDFIAIGGAPMKEAVDTELVKNGVNLLNHWGATEIGAIALIQPITDDYDYDWHYLIPRQDIGLEFQLVDANTRSYKLVRHPHGWSEPFYVQDALEMHPTSHTTQVQILGRTDDLVVIATGEKVRPTMLEQTIAEHPFVKDALVFGEGRPHLGMLVEVSRSFINESDREAFVESLEPYFECATAFPFPKNDPSALRALVMESYREGADYFVASSGDHADFFEVSMNSLQATRLRASIQNSLRKTLDLPSLNVVLDFCFQNSTLEKLTSAVYAFMAGEHSPTLDVKLAAGRKETLRIAIMLAAFQRYAAELDGYRKQLVDADPVCYINRMNHSANGSPGKVVVLTGSTGSLGSFLLALLAADSAVTKVFYLNRPREGGRDAMKHQRQVMESRGVRSAVFFEARMGEAGSGPDQSQYQELLSLTHLIHNAWPVDFNRSLSSFDTHLQAVCNLIQLCLSAVTTGPQSIYPKRLLFASSITVAGRYPIVHPEGPGDVPEAELEPECTDDFGYPEAKWVCEKILLEVNRLFGTSTSKNVDEDARGPLLITSSLRIGQMTGLEGSGAWNETVHFPIIVRTSQEIKALPRVEGSLSWMRVNRAASVVIELLFSTGFRPIYHLENPSRQSWANVLDGLAAILGSKDAPLPIILFNDWLDRARALGEDPSYNYALKVMHFLDQDFIRMASGTVVLRTASTKMDSPTLLRSTSLDKRPLEEYVAYWRKQKFLY